MENQRKITGEPIDQNVGESIAGSKANERVKSYYDNIVRNLRGTSRPKVFPFSENAGEVSGVFEKQEVARCLDANMSKGVTPEGFFERGRRNLVMGTVTQAFDRSGCSCEELEMCYKIHRANELRTHKGSSTLTSNMGQGGNNQPMVMSLYPRSSKTGKGGSGTLVKTDGSSFCLDTGNMQGVEDINLIRRLTPLECEKLQSFPQNWTKYGIDSKGNKVEISNTQRYKMCGNAVTVNVIESLARKLN